MAEEEAELCYDSLRVRKHKFKLRRKRRSSAGAPQSVETINIRGNRDGATGDNLRPRIRRR